MRPMTKEEAFEEAMSVKSTETRPLWSVAAQEWNAATQSWDFIIRYNHAENEAEARATYMRARTTPARIIAAGIAIGYFVMDTQGKKLSV